MEKVLGLDLGTNSIGYSIRENNGECNKNQFIKYGVIRFKTGVGSEKGNEFSYAARRTEYRSKRRLYQSRKYRIWETLDVLMKNGYCPITKDELDQWRCYDKSKGYIRKYPVDAQKFDQWIKLDFNGDGKPDFISPYQLRKEVATKKLILQVEKDRFMLGRALYHIAQRRGFKSSKGETVKNREKEQESVDLIENTQETEIDLKKSEQKISSKLDDFIKTQISLGNEIKTVGWALADIENTGDRIRENWISIRKQYEDEIKYIFSYQPDLELDSVFYKQITRAIFYQRPLRSQKGLVGNCTLEPSKTRCPISHYEFEEFRAWSFINNIQFKKELNESNWCELDTSLKEEIYNECFMKVKKSFDFEDIKKLCLKKLSLPNIIFNYKDNVNVAGCPISARLKNIFGHDWKNVVIQSDKCRTESKIKEKKITYTIDDIWHVLYTFEDEDKLSEFALNGLKLPESKKLINCWLAMPQGYSMLSLKAIRNVNKFLRKGMKYTDATLLAKIPEIVGTRNWANYEELFINAISSIIINNREHKRLLNIVNSLISKYKALPVLEQFAYKDYDYKLQPKDLDDIKNTLVDSFGKASWDKIETEKQVAIFTEVQDHYQRFFSSFKRDYYLLPKLSDSLADFLRTHFTVFNCTVKNNTAEQLCDCYGCKQLRKIYHPSMIEYYSPARLQTVEFNTKVLSLRLLGNPAIGSFKNPMALRTLHELKKLINRLLLSGDIDESTRVVVEIARELNDSNKRWAIRHYQDIKEKENKEFAFAIAELRKEKGLGEIIDTNFTNEVDKLRVLIDQHSEALIISKDSEKSKGKVSTVSEKFYRTPNFLREIMFENDIVKKYRLWKEQGFRCIYTGKFISITDLFDENKVDIEHTIPRSLCFDDSLSNLTVCDAHYNRHKKKQQIPYHLDNYSEILENIKPWFEKIKSIERNIELCKKKSRQATDKELKDHAIRLRHLWQFELDYWKNKCGRFEMKEVKSGFKNSQLVDTQIISKYAYHYLRSVFDTVEVQKGSITAKMRKIIGVQGDYEKKNRDFHSHHAIDACILSLIPKSNLRDKLLNIQFEIEDKQKLLRCTDSETAEVLNNEINTLKIKKAEILKQCRLNDLGPFVTDIQEKIVINNISRDKSLIISKKLIRKRGKTVPIYNKDNSPVFQTESNGNIVYKKHKDGNLVYKRNHEGKLMIDEYGNKIPIPLLKERIATGDCIRGQLHDESLLGAIKVIKRDSSMKPVKGVAGFIYEDNLKYVIRKNLKFKKDSNDSGFANLAELEKCIVDPHLFLMIKSQVEKAGSFKEACDAGIHMLNKKGEKVNKIRHIRVFVRCTEPVLIRRQVYKSNKTLKNLHNRNHKEFVYANNASNPYYLLYEGTYKDKLIRDYKIFNLMEAKEFNKNGKLDAPPIIYYKNLLNCPLRLTTVLTNGLKVLFYKESASELLEMETSRLLQRLYIITGFEKDGRIKFTYHLEARDDKRLMIDFPEDIYGKNGKNGFSAFNWEQPWPKLKLSIGNLNMLIENVDFELSVSGELIFNKSIQDALVYD